MLSLDARHHEHPCINCQCNIATARVSLRAVHLANTDVQRYTEDIFHVLFRFATLIPVWILSIAPALAT